MSRATYNAMAEAAERERKDDQFGQPSAPRKPRKPPHPQHTDYSNWTDDRLAVDVKAVANDVSYAKPADRAELLGEVARRLNRAATAQRALEQDAIDQAGAAAQARVRAVRWPAQDEPKVKVNIDDLRSDLVRRRRHKPEDGSTDDALADAKTMIENQFPYEAHTWRRAMERLVSAVERERDKDTFVNYMVEAVFSFTADNLAEAADTLETIEDLVLDAFDEGAIHVSFGEVVEA